MPFILAALAVLLLVVFATVVLIPITLIQRYRAGTARRQARAWLATINIAGLSLSLLLFLTGAALTSVWVPDALTYSSLGVLAGMAIGGVGLALTRWDRAAGVWFYTPNRWLVLAITLGVAARLGYGFLRAWRAATAGGEQPWIETAGVAGSLAAGALILGYYLTFWIGIRRAIARA